MGPPALGAARPAARRGPQLHMCVWGAQVGLLGFCRGRGDTRLACRRRDRRAARPYAPQVSNPMILTARRAWPPHTCSRPRAGGEAEREWREGPRAARIAKAPILGQVTARG